MMKTEDDMWVCGSCGYETGRSAESEEMAVTTQGQESSEVVDTSEADDRGSLPRVWERPGVLRDETDTGRRRIRDTVFHLHRV